MNILLDRDGTVIEECHYLSDPAHVRLTPGAGPALAKAARAGRGLIMVTNQSGLGRGHFSLAQYQAVQTRLCDLLRPFGATFTATAICPHAPDAECACRKPRPGLWTWLRRELALRPEQSVMVGDKATDIQFARNCGLAAAVLVLTGYGRTTARAMGLPELHDDWLELPGRNPGRPDVLASDLAAAVSWILNPARGTK